VLILRYYPRIRLEGFKKITKDLSQYSRSPGRVEPGTSRIRSRSVNHSTTKFGNNLEEMECHNTSKSLNNTMLKYTAKFTVSELLRSIIRKPDVCIIHHLSCRKCNCKSRKEYSGSIHTRRH
jgi:hypothetical protein